MLFGPLLICPSCFCFSSFFGHVLAMALAYLFLGIYNFFFRCSSAKEFSNVQHATCYVQRQQQQRQQLVINLLCVFAAANKI